MYGFYAYSALPSDIPLDTILKQAKMRLCHHISWFENSRNANSILLYESEPFLWIKPNPALFYLPAEEVASEQTVVRAGSATKRTINIGLRINENESYEKFKARWGQTQELIDLVKSRNHLDYDLYEFALRLFCARLQETGWLSLLFILHDASQQQQQHQQQLTIENTRGVAFENSASITRAPLDLLRTRMYSSAHYLTIIYLFLLLLQVL